MTEATQAVRLLVAVAMLVGASWSDLRTRRVANMYWMPFLAIAGLLALGDLLPLLTGHDGPPGLPQEETPTGQELLWAYGIAFALCAFFYGLWRLRLFGGADAKGLMVLALLLPWPQDEAVPLPTALDALANASLFMLVLPVLFALSNVAAGRVAFPAMLLGRVLLIDQAEARHVWPLQRVDETGALGWRFFHQPGEELGPTYDALRAAGVRTVWVTPKIPFMVPLAAGLAATWWYGNLLVRAFEAYAS